MPNKDLAAKLGLDPETATQDEIDTAVLAKLDEAPAPVETAPASVSLPEGTVAIDEAALTELRENAMAGRQASNTLAERDRDEFLTGAVMAGKFPPARSDHYKALYDADPEGTRTLVDGLADGLVPVTPGVGHAGSFETASDDQIWNALFPAPKEA